MNSIPLSDRFCIATADTLFENVHYVAHCSEVQHSHPMQCYSWTPVLERRDILRTNGLGQPPCQRRTFRCSWRGTTSTSRQWRSHNEWVSCAIRI